MYIDDWEIIYAKELLMIEFESLHACKENYVYEEKKTVILNHYWYHERWGWIDINLALNIIKIQREMKEL